MSPDSRWVSLKANSGPPDPLLTGVRYIHFESWIPGTGWEGESGAENQALLLETVLVRVPMPHSDAEPSVTVHTASAKVLAVLPATSSRPRFSYTEEGLQGIPQTFHQPA